MMYTLVNKSGELMKLVFESGDRLIGASYLIIPARQSIKADLAEETKQMLALKKRKLLEWTIEEPKVEEPATEVPTVVQADPAPVAEEATEFQCEVCADLFTTKKALTKHLKTHEQS